MSSTSDRVVIGMDPHKRSATIEVMTADEAILGGGRFGTDRDGYAAMLRYARQWPDRVWAIEGCAGHRQAHRQPAAGRRRAGRRRATEAVRAGAGVRHRSGPQDRRHRRALGRAGRHPDGRAAAGGQRRAARGAADPGRPPPVARRGPHPDGLPAAPAAARADPGRREEGPVRPPGQGAAGQGPPRDAAGKTRRRVAAELISDLERIYARKKAANKELTELLAATGTGLLDLPGIGPSGAARLLVEVGDITRFPNKAHFASWNGTAPIDASSGDQVRHRLSRAGNRQINRVLHIMARVQIRNPSEGRDYYDRKKADGKAPMEAMRCVKRRLSDIVYQQMLNDAVTHTGGRAREGNRDTTLTPA